MFFSLSPSSVFFSFCFFFCWCCLLCSYVSSSFFFLFSLCLAHFSASSSPSCVPLTSSSHSLCRCGWVVLPGFNVCKQRVQRISFQQIKIDFSVPVARYQTVCACVCCLNQNDCGILCDTCTYFVHTVHYNNNNEKPEEAYYRRNLCNILLRCSHRSLSPSQHLFRSFEREHRTAGATLWPQTDHRFPILFNCPKYSSNNTQNVVTERRRDLFSIVFGNQVQIQTLGVLKCRRSDHFQRFLDFKVEWTQTRTHSTSSDTKIYFRSKKIKCTLLVDSISYEREPTKETVTIL